MQQKSTLRTRACVAALVALASLGIQSGFGLCLSVHHAAHVIPLGAAHDCEGEPDTGGHHDDAAGPCSDAGCCIDLPIQVDLLTPHCFVPVQAPFMAFVIWDDVAAPAAIPADSSCRQRHFFLRNSLATCRSLPLRL